MPVLCSLPMQRAGTHHNLPPVLTFELAHSTRSLLRDISVAMSFQYVLSLGPPSVLSLPVSSSCAYGCPFWVMVVWPCGSILPLLQ